VSLKSVFEQREHRHTDIESIYVAEEDRFVVGLIVGYHGTEEDPFPRNAKEAAAAALRLTTDEGASDTHWFVFDRKTGKGRFLEQGEFEGIHVP
jgi:hypothetical protein